MKRGLRECRARTSNAIEAYHRTVYRVLRKNEQSAPVLAALPVLLLLVKDDIKLLRSFFNCGELPTYDRAIYRTNKSSAVVYHEQDSNTETECPALQPEDPQVQHAIEDLGDATAILKI